MMIRKSNMKKQVGIVLIVSLVFLIALTAIASTLMLNTVIDIKIAGSNQDKVIAQEEAIGDLQVLMQNKLANGAAFNETKAINCPASKQGNSSNIVKCVVTHVSYKKQYGKNNSSVIEVNSGIVKQVLALVDE